MWPIVTKIWSNHNYLVFFGYPIVFTQSVIEGFHDAVLDIFLRGAV